MAEKHRVNIASWSKRDFVDTWDEITQAAQRHVRFWFCFFVENSTQIQCMCVELAWKFFCPRNSRAVTWIRKMSPEPINPRNSEWWMGEILFWDERSLLRLLQNRLVKNLSKKISYDTNEISEDIWLGVSVSMRAFFIVILFVLAPYQNVDLAPAVCLHTANYWPGMHPPAFSLAHPNAKTRWKRSFHF